jgi:hypothetical protein
MAHNIDISSLTLAELVTAVAGSLPEIRRDLVERRVANWVTRGVLEPVGELHTGSGRSRLFHPDAAYVAAVLMRLPTRSIPEVTAIATVLKIELAKGGDVATWWAAAKNRKEVQQGRTVFAAFNVRLDEAGEKPTAVELQLGQGDRFNSPPIYVQGLSAIVINLSDAFHGVRLP